MTRKINNGDQGDERKTRVLKPVDPNIQGTPGNIGMVAPASDDKKTRIVRPVAGGQGLPTRPAGTEHAATRIQTPANDPVVGWLVVIKGPGRGQACPFYYGMNQVGRDASQRVPVNFGDSTISRDSHALIIYDDKERKFYAQHGGKANLVRVNNAPLMTPIELKHGDRIEMGDTILMFVPLCGPDFDWQNENAGLSEATPDQS